MRLQIIAADRIIDRKGDHTRTNELIQCAHVLGIKTAELRITSLSEPWNAELPENHFKSGASAMDALEKARSLLKAREAAIVIIKGEDLLRSGYTKDEREKYMKLYAGKHTPLDGYNELVEPFIQRHGISEEEFFKIRDCLFDNYAKTWKGLLPDARWFKPITKYFRGVDCANPNIDYSGQIIISNEEHADLLQIPDVERVSILGNTFTRLAADGLESIPHIAPYDHLKEIIDHAISEAKIDFKGEFLKRNALLEVYSCYPVVPMALLLKLGLVKHLSEIPDLLNSYEVTITGGLNLAKAPWNLTSLNFLITMREKLLSSHNYKYGLVHGNGSLGNQQGITILGQE
jgi:hypothetical protein